MSNWDQSKIFRHTSFSSPLKLNLIYLIAEKVSFEDMQTICHLILEMVALDGETQVSGVVIIIDAKSKNGCKFAFKQNQKKCFNNKIIV